MKGEKENPLRIGGLEQDQVSPGVYPGLPPNSSPSAGPKGQRSWSTPRLLPQRSPVSAAGTRQANANRKTPKPRCPVSSSVPSPAKYTSSPFKSRRLQSPQPRGLSSLKLLEQHRGQLFCSPQPLLSLLPFLPWGWAPTYSRTSPVFYPSQPDVQNKV